MINRRTTLVGMLTAGAVTLCSDVVGLVPAGEAAHETREGAGTDDAAEAALRQDLARMGDKAYSDEGIPVFLACENLFPSSPVELTEFSARVAADFRSTAVAWRRIHPEAPATDVSKVIEVLAERDFTRTGEGRGS
jgi:hypothetical protein